MLCGLWHSIPFTLDVMQNVRFYFCNRRRRRKRKTGKHKQSQYWSHIIMICVRKSNEASTKFVWRNHLSVNNWNTNRNLHIFVVLKSIDIEKDPHFPQKWCKRSFLLLLLNDWLYRYHYRLLRQCSKQINEMKWKMEEKKSFTTNLQLKLSIRNQNEFKTNSERYSMSFTSASKKFNRWTWLIFDYLPFVFPHTRDTNKENN